ncbi:hypothetical protein BDV06DRAFT_196459 [Aspergillus oleicola]
MVITDGHNEVASRFVTDGPVTMPENPRSGSAFQVERDTTMDYYWWSCYGFSYCFKLPFACSSDASEDTGTP